MMITTSEPEPEYIGDGVYASFDGYQIWLHLEAHTAPGLIALEPAVMNNLYLYAKRCFPAKPREANNAERE